VLDAPDTLVEADVHCWLAHGREPLLVLARLCVRY
jgi:hypothetical protein